MRRRGLSFSWPLLLVLGACAAQPAAAPDATQLYEDVPDPGKADGAGLTAAHKVAGYTPTQDRRVVTGDLEASTFAGRFTLRAGDRLLLVRQLELDGTASHIAFDVDRLRVGILAASAVAQKTRPATATELAGAAYVSALAAQRDATYSTLRDGEAEPGHVRFALTIDMCQSGRLWERGLFDWLVSLAEERGEPTPVGIAMTGLWASWHPRELAQLLAWQAAGKLDITWINHSYRHELSKDAAGAYHFLTDPRVDFRSDVLDLERLLLGQGVLFSPLFRFPGLTHDRARRAELNDLSLVAIDADGWIAKGEPIADGAVVLLHGNGNERVGVDRFFDQVEERGEETLELVAPTEVMPRPTR